MAHEEYLRRNLKHAASIGAVSAINTIQNRLASVKKKPKWLLASLQAAMDRAETLPRELAGWRDSAPDAPKRLDQP